jgi:hypothetical protein
MPGPSGPRLGGREIQVVVRDRFGDPLKAADIEISIGGRTLGRVFTGGDGVAGSLVSVDSLQGVIHVRVTASDGTVQEANVPPETNKVELQFDFSPLIKAKLPALAMCPDGTSGYPCVTCHDGNDIWQICT